VIVGAERKSWRSERDFISGGGKNIVLVGYRSLPTRPSDKGGLKVKTLEQ
jgi:hypothetical protein